MIHSVYNPRSWRAAAKWIRRYKVSPLQIWRGGRVLRTVIKNKRFLSTLPRSGTFYLAAILTSATEIEAGLAGDYQYENDEWVHGTRLWYPGTLHDFIQVLGLGYPFNNNAFVQVHHPHQIADLLSIGRMKVVFTVRNIFDQLESRSLMPDFGVGNQDAFIREGHVENTIRYLNYWGDFADGRVAGKDYICIKYEDLISNPVAVVSRISQMWELNLTEGSLRTAVNLCSRENMVSKISSDSLSTTERISLRGDRGQLFSSENVSYIREAITDKLRHGFGYEY